MSQVRLFAEFGEEARHIVGIGNLVFGFDGDQESQRRIAFEIFETGIHRDVPQGDGQDEGAPEDLDGIVVTTFAAGFAQGMEQGVVGDGFEEETNGIERGRIFKSVPGKQGFGDGDFHGGSPDETRKDAACS